MNTPCCAHSKIEKKVVGVGEGRMIDTWQCKTCDTYFQPKEKEIEKQKFQFESEEQAREIFDTCIETENEDHDELVDRCLEHAKNCGYIRKSELQTLVDEAEEMFYQYGRASKQDLLHCKLFDAIHALKKSHPEFKE